MAVARPIHAALVALALMIAPLAALERRSVPFASTPEGEEAVRALRDGPIDAFREGSFTAADGTVLPYRLASPAGPGPHPLVLLIHGAGSMGRDNVAQLNEVAKAFATPDLAARYPAYLLVPQVATRSCDYEMAGDGLMASYPGRSFPALMGLLDDLARRLPVDPSRIYVVGFSMGASTALNAVTAEPGRFAGAVAFSPVAPHRPLAAGAAATPVYLVHGDRDGSNPIEPLRAWSAAFAAAGGQGVFAEYLGMDHRVPADLVAAHGWGDWLFAQRRN